MVTLTAMNTKAKAAKPASEMIEMGSCNVFADLGLPDRQERQLRVQLAVALTVCRKLKA